MKFSMDRLINKITGRRWQFYISFRYTLYPDHPERGNVEQTHTFSVNDRNVLGDSHYIKKVLAGDMVKNLPKHLRTNGTLHITGLNYIGFYRDSPKKVRTGKIGHKTPWYMA